ncbi:hypothetical protein D3C86_1685870 [compost metagenome]
MRSPKAWAWRLANGALASRMPAPVTSSWRQIFNRSPTTVMVSIGVKRPSALTVRPKRAPSGSITTLACGTSASIQPAIAGKSRLSDASSCSENAL